MNENRILMTDRPCNRGIVRLFPKVDVRGRKMKITN